MKYIHSLYIGLLSLLFVGCQEEQLNNMQTGGFQISLQDVAADITTKTLPKDLEGPIVSNFHLKITNENNGISAYDGAYISDLIPASTGIYSITATHGDNPPLAKDDPYYKGDTTGVELEEDQVASVELKCLVANALASVVYTSEAMFKEVFTDYGVKVGIGDLTVDLENGTTESAYYQAGSIPTFTFVGTLKGNGKEVTKVLEDTKLTDPSTFAAGQHCKITLSLSTTTAGVNLHIEKVEATPVSITATIPMEWLPAPKVSATGFDGRNTLTIYETEKASSASIDFNVAQPLQDLYFKLKFEDENLSSLNKGEGAEYQLSEMSEEEKSAFTSAGIILPSIGSTEPQIIFSEDFISKLLSKNDGTVSNVIVIDSVKANDRINKDESPLSYTIAVNKPEFTVSAYPGNIWTKEFTMNALMEDQVTEGDFSKLSTNMTYQFSPNGESDWTVLGKDLRKDGLTPGTTYYIRGVYRGEVCSDPVAVSTYPIIELENGGLEGARITIGTDGKIAQDRGARYAWDGWATTNPLTTPNCHAAAYAHNSRSGVRPTTDKPNTSQGTEAVRVITIGYGYGSTYKNQNYFIHSELFLGTDPEEENDNRTYGISYASHPTGISFYYKCISNVGNDFSEAKIEIYHENELLGSGVFQTGAKSNYEYKKLDIKYIENEEILKLEPTKIVVIFKSGTKSDLSQSDLKKMFGSDNFITGNTNTTADCMWRGNELFIDDISLVYDK